jgi:hypothetical protein
LILGQDSPFPPATRKRPRRSATHDATSRFSFANVSLIHFPLESAQIQDNLPLEQWGARQGAARLESAPAA